MSDPDASPEERFIPSAGEFIALCEHCNHPTKSHWKLGLAGYRCGCGCTCFSFLKPVAGEIDDITYSTSELT